MPAIQTDMRRLHEMLILAQGQFHAHLRAWLIVICEALLPTQFVTSRGRSQRGVHEIEGLPDGGWYVVRKTCKAIAQLENISKAHYGCLIEVFTSEPKQIAKNVFDVPG